MNGAGVACHAAPFKWEDFMKLACAAVAAALLGASPVKAQVVDQMANIMFWFERLLYRGR
jgi:hypothetical protein